MLQKHSKDGLVVIGVTLDDPRDEKARAGVLKYLAEKKITLPHYHLDVDPEKRPKTLDFGGGVPGAFVFNRANQHVKKLPRLDAKGEPVEDFDYGKIDRAVEEELKRK